MCAVGTMAEHRGANMDPETRPNQATVVDARFLTMDPSDSKEQSTTLHLALNIIAANLLYDKPQSSAAPRRGSQARLDAASLTLPCATRRCARCAYRPPGPLPALQTQAGEGSSPSPETGCKSPSGSTRLICNRADCR